MNDERPLSETDPLVARLIEAARRREPPREGLAATLEAVSAISTPASALVPSRDTSNATSPTSSFALKAALGLGLCALLIGGPFVAFPEAASPAGVRETDAPPATFRNENSPPAVLREADDPSAAAVELQTPPPMTPLPAAEERPSVRPSIRVEDLPSAIVASPARPREAAQGSLADELAMLEQARTLLSSGQSGPCLSLLNRYAARYPRTRPKLPESRRYRQPARQRLPLLALARSCPAGPTARTQAACGRYSKGQSHDEYPYEQWATALRRLGFGRYSRHGDRVRLRRPRHHRW